MEMQILCSGNVDGKPVTAVISVLMQSHQNEKMKNGFLDSFWDSLPATPNTACTKNTTVNLADLLPKDISYHASTGGLRIAYPYYYYEGSLSSPPCKEGVKTFLWYKPVDVFEEQVIVYQKLLEKMNVKQGNARAPQPLGARDVELKTLF
jgi:carbonic anhydrase